MKITSQEEYGLRCVVRVALEQGGGPVSAQTIAECEGLTVSYVQKLMRVLVHGGLVEATRGAHGGYTLVRAPEFVSLGAIIRVLGGMIETEHMCGKFTGEHDVCIHHGDCSIRPVWSTLSEFIIATFERIPLTLLMRGEDEVAGRLMAMVPPQLMELPCESLVHPAERDRR
ncbi:MAG: Rrf2 family transcriptional regulator [Myxococcota bacterium]